MGIGHEEAKRLTWWEFTALRHEWDLRHKVDDPAGAPVPPPDVETVRAAQADLYASGIAGAAS